MNGLFGEFFLSVVEHLADKPSMSRTKEVNLTFPYFLFSFLFLFQFIFLYSIFRTRVRVRVTRLHCHTAGHIR